MRPIEGKQAQDIPLALKEHHDGILCDKHYLQLSKIVKKRKIEEVSHVVEPAQMEERSPEPLSGAEEVPESQEEHTTNLSTSITTLAVSRPQAIRKGRPLKYPEHVRFKLAVGSALGVSLNKVGQLYALFQSDDFSEASLTNSPSRTLAVQCLMELHTCFRYHLAEQLTNSTNISLTMDSTTDRHRELLSLFFAGTRQGEKGEDVGWNLPGGVVEMNGHTAVIQVDVVEKVLGELNVLQRERNWSVTRMYHISFSFFFFLVSLKPRVNFYLFWCTSLPFWEVVFLRIPMTYTLPSSKVSFLGPSPTPHVCLPLPSPPLSPCVALGALGVVFFFIRQEFTH